MVGGMVSLGWVRMAVVVVMVLVGVWGQDNTTCTVTMPSGLDREYQNCPVLTNGVQLYYTVEGDQISIAFMAELPDGDEGYVGLGFPAIRGAMVGSEDTTTAAVIAYASSLATDSPFVGDYALRSKASSAVQIEDLQSLEDVEVGVENGIITASFTRKLQIDGLTTIEVDQEMGLIWARGPPPRDSGSLQWHGGTDRGAPSITFSSTAAGSDGDVTEGSTYSAIYVAHGAMMIAAICFLMPAGVILLRILNNKLADPWWFRVHRGIMTLATVLIFSAFIMAVSRAPHTETTHLGIGSTVFALVVLQFLVAAFLPPGLDSPYRNKFRIGHRINAGILRGLGAANVFIGIGILAQNTVIWYVIAGVVLGVMVVFEIITSAILYPKFSASPDREPCRPASSVIPPADDMEK